MSASLERRLEVSEIFGLGLLALMVSGPFVFPVHTAPLGSFWSEWFACWVGLGAICFCLIGQGVRRQSQSTVSVPLPRVLLIPAVLVCAVLIQFATGRVDTPQLGIIFAAYLLWAALLATLGQYVQRRFGLSWLTEILAIAIGIGALIGAIAVIVQWLGIAQYVPGVYVSPSGIGEANIAQRNHHAHYSWLGVASAFYLHGRRRFSRLVMWTVVLTIAFGSVLSGSRSIFLYPFVLIFVLLLLQIKGQRSEDNQDYRNLLIDAALLLPILFALNLFLSWSTPHLLSVLRSLFRQLLSSSVGGLEGYVDVEDVALPISRLYDELPGPSIKLASVRAAWLAFLETPILGQGVGSFRWASFWSASRNVGGDYLIVAEHAHNFEFQLLAEFGGPITFCVVLLCFAWIRAFVLQKWRLEHFWIGSVLGVCAVHSQLEYPLWYSYFLGLTALLLGAADLRTTIALPAKRAVGYVLVVTLGSAVALWNLGNDYRKIEMAIYQPFSSHWDREKAWKATIDQLLTIHSDSLLSPWVLRMINTYAQPDRNLASDRADVCERGLRFSPDRSLVTKCVVHLSIAGRHDRSQELLNATLNAFPTERSSTISEISRFADKFPEIAKLRTDTPAHLAK